MAEGEDIVTPAAYILFYKRRGINFDTLNYDLIRNKLQEESPIKEIDPTLDDVDDDVVSQTPLL